jgi:hypothetical protein
VTKVWRVGLHRPTDFSRFLENRTLEYTLQNTGPTGPSAGRGTVHQKYQQSGKETERRRGGREWRRGEIILHSLFYSLFYPLPIHCLFTVYSLLSRPHTIDITVHLNPEDSHFCIGIHSSAVHPLCILYPPSIHNDEQGSIGYMMDGGFNDLHLYRCTPIQPSCNRTVLIICTHHCVPYSTSGSIPERLFKIDSAVDLSTPVVCSL